VIRHSTLCYVIFQSFNEAGRKRLVRIDDNARVYLSQYLTLVNRWKLLTEVVPAVFHGIFTIDASASLLIKGSTPRLYVRGVEISGKGDIAGALRVLTEQHDGEGETFFF